MNLFAFLDFSAGTGLHPSVPHSFLNNPLVSVLDQNASSFHSSGDGAKPGAQIQPHDFIAVLNKTKEGIISKCAPLYEKGLSLREISAETGIPKTTIRVTLTRSGMELRNFETGKNVPSLRTKAKRPGHAPYGYGYLSGELVVDPKEFSIVQKIIKKWQSGKSAYAIAQELNVVKTQTRLGGFWRTCVVKQIIEREISLK